MHVVKFNVYGRFQIEGIRVGESWTAFQLVPGKRIALHDFSIPAWMSADEIAAYLDDIYRELGGPGDLVRAIPQDHWLRPVRQLPRLAPENSINEYRIADDRGQRD